MQINKPEDFTNALEHVIAAMDRAGRVRLLKWMKYKKNYYDLNYPLGYKPEQKEEKKDDQSVNAVTEPVILPTL